MSGETGIPDRANISGDDADAAAASCAWAFAMAALGLIRAWRVAWFRLRFLASVAALLASLTASWSSSSCFQAYSGEEREGEGKSEGEGEVEGEGKSEGEGEGKNEGDGFDTVPAP